MPLSSWRLLAPPDSTLTCLMKLTPPTFKNHRCIKFLIQQIWRPKLYYLPAEWPWESDMVPYSVGGIIMPIFCDICKEFCSAHSNTWYQGFHGAQHWTRMDQHPEDLQRLHGRSLFSCASWVVWGPINCQQEWLAPFSLAEHSYLALRVPNMGSGENLFPTEQRQQLPGIWPSFALEDELLKWRGSFLHAVFLKKVFHT